MKKYFVCSDIHGFYKEWMSSLDEVGFDINNNEHILIVLGDIFDRGREPWKIYQFLKSIPDNRLVLVKGNHEYLLLQLVERKFPFEFDHNNGTYKTLVDLNQNPLRSLHNWEMDNRFKYTAQELYLMSESIYRKFRNELYDNKKLSEIVEWIKSPKWLNYYELGKYIFVHSFIPLKGIDNIYVVDNIGEYYPDWREETKPNMWEMATWGCPYRQYQSGAFDKEKEKGKILVCGHWHTSDFYNELLYQDEPYKKLDYRKENPIFKSDLVPFLIAIDACTALTRKVNVLVINEEEIY